MTRLRISPQLSVQMSAAGIPGLSCGDDPDFRVRILALTPSGADVEIHIREKNCVTRSAAFLEECRLVFTKTPSLRLLNVRHLKTLSGYFDKMSKWAWLYYRIIGCKFVYEKISHNILYWLAFIEILNGYLIISPPKGSFFSGVL